MMFFWVHISVFLGPEIKARNYIFWVQIYSFLGPEKNALVITLVSIVLSGISMRKREYTSMIPKI